MRRTLSIISLAAALATAMSASAASLTDAVYSTLTPTESIDVSSYDVSGSYSVTYTLDASAVASILGNGTTASSVQTNLLSVTSSSTHTIGTNMAVVSSDSYGIYATMTAASTGSTSIISDRYSISNISYATDYDFSNVESVAITMIHTNTTSTTYVFTFTIDGVTTTLSGSYTTLKWSAGFGSLSTIGVNTDLVTSVYLFDSALDTTTAAALNTAAVTASVPEPATASLSLLGLGALLLRRRRN